MSMCEQITSRKFHYRLYFTLRIDIGKLTRCMSWSQSWMGAESAYCIQPCPDFSRCNACAPPPLRKLSKRSLGTVPWTPNHNLSCRTVINLTVTSGHRTDLAGESAVSLHEVAGYRIRAPNETVFAALSWILVSAHWTREWGNLGPG